MLVYRCEVEVTLSEERSGALELNRSELSYWLSHLPASYLTSWSLNSLIYKMEPTIPIYSLTQRWQKLIEKNVGRAFSTVTGIWWKFSEWQTHLLTSIHKYMHPE